MYEDPHTKRRVEARKLGRRLKGESPQALGADKLRRKHWEGSWEFVWGVNKGEFKEEVHLTQRDVQWLKFTSHEIQHIGRTNCGGVVNTKSLNQQHSPVANSHLSLDSLLKNSCLKPWSLLADALECTGAVALRVYHPADGRGLNMHEVDS